MMSALSAVYLVLSKIPGELCEGDWLADLIAPSGGAIRQSLDGDKYLQFDLDTVI